MELHTSLFDAIDDDVCMRMFKDMLVNAGNECSHMKISLDDETLVTPLGYAGKLLRTEIVKTLLEVASDDDINDSVWHALNHCRGNVEVVKAFVKHGVDVNIVLDDKKYYPYVTPMLAAVGNRNETLLQYLIDNGANVNYCRQGTDICPFGLAFYDAYKFGVDNILKLLITNGLDVNENEGESLFVAFENSMQPRWKEFFELCLDHGANLSIKPFMYHAAKTDNIDMMKHLIERGIKAEHEARYNGHIALHVAIGNSDKELNAVELLLNWGSDVNAQVTPIGDDLYDTFLVGFSALHYAGSQADLDKLVTLLDYGADVHVVNCSNVSVLFQLLDAICKDKSLYEVMVFSSKHVLNNVMSSYDGDMKAVQRKAIKRLEQYKKMTQLLLASGACLLDSEFMISYDSPYVVMSSDVLNNTDTTCFLVNVRSLIDNVKDTLRKPRSLQDMCRVKIRSTLPKKKSESINKLRSLLPRTLLSYLKFDDILL